MLNTKNSINYNSEFISTVKGDSFKGDTIALDLEKSITVAKEVNMREFIGLTGTELTQFNKKLIQTFKNIYTYNPDYDSLTVNLGKVLVDAKKPYFTSNLVSIDSDLQLPDNKTLNDFIYIGPILFSEYLTLLNKYSENSLGNKIQINDYLENKPLKTVCFVPSLMYCGTPENYYLISSLTYNIPEPTELNDELSFKAASSLILRHENGEIEFINGQINKKAFYGFSKDLHKLIQLDVSNYEIDKDDGNLTLKSDIEETNSYAEEITDPSTVEIVQLAATTGYLSDKTFKSTNSDDNSNFSPKL